MTEPQHDSSDPDPGLIPEWQVENPGRGLLLSDHRLRWLRGERVAVEDYLERFPDLRDDPEAVLDLVYQEVGLRVSAGERPEAEEYTRRLPEYAEPLRFQFELASTSRPASGSRGPSGGNFLEDLTSADLLDDTLLQASAPLCDASRNPRDAADELVAKGWLTPFQCDRLLRGRGQELALQSYRLVGRLGSGGMGEVFLARDRNLGRLVALKVLHQRSQSTAEIDRFRREAMAVARLSHPNVVTLYEAADSDGAPFLAMEYVRGRDLKRIVQDEHPLPVAVACGYARQAALGLQCAHESGLVHRDIKPSNLLVGPPSEPGGLGQVKVVDFGVARHDESMTALTPRGDLMGTPDFVAPEQIEDATRVDARADLYSLGCTLYFLLTGKGPFGEAPLWEKLAKHREAEPTPVEDLRPGLPPGLPVVVRRMMAKRPDDRLPNAAAVADALAPFCEPRGAWIPVESPGASKSPAGPRRGRRRAIAALALATLGVPAASLVIPRVRPRAADPLAVGRRWSGRFRGDPPSVDFLGYVEIQINERRGEAFRGIYACGTGESMDEPGWRAGIDGVLRGEMIRWSFTKTDLDDRLLNLVEGGTVAGTLKGDVMAVRLIVRGSTDTTTLKLWRDAVPADPLPVGSEWSGSLRGFPLESNALEEFRATITKRDGQGFEGVTHGPDAARSFRGTFQDRAIRWSFDRPIRYRPGERASGRTTADGKVRGEFIQGVLRDQTGKPQADVKLWRDR